MKRRIMIGDYIRRKRIKNRQTCFRLFPDFSFNVVINISGNSCGLVLGYIPNTMNPAIDAIILLEQKLVLIQEEFLLTNFSVILPKLDKMV